MGKKQEGLKRKQFCGNPSVPQFLSYFLALFYFSVQIGVKDIPFGKT